MLLLTEAPAGSMHGNHRALGGETYTRGRFRFVTDVWPKICNHKKCLPGHISLCTQINTNGLDPGGNCLWIMCTSLFVLCEGLFSSILIAHCLPCGGPDLVSCCIRFHERLCVTVRLRSSARTRVFLCAREHREGAHQAYRFLVASPSTLPCTRPGVYFCKGPNHVIKSWHFNTCPPRCVAAVHQQDAQNIEA